MSKVEKQDWDVLYKDTPFGGLGGGLHKDTFKGYASEADVRRAFHADNKYRGKGLVDIRPAGAIDKMAFTKPIPWWCAPSGCTPDYQATEDFRYWLAYAMTVIAGGWEDTLYERPGFINMLKWAQQKFLFAVADLIRDYIDPDDGPNHEDQVEFSEDYTKTVLSVGGERFRVHQEWGDASGKRKEFPHVMLQVFFEFRKADNGAPFQIMADIGEVSSDERTIWFQPGNEVSTEGWEAIAEYMLEELAKAQEELDTFWRVYEVCYPLSEQPEEIRG
jgi:hypothetical protein